MQGLGRAALVAFDIFLSKLLGLEVIVGMNNFIVAAGVVYIISKFNCPNSQFVTQKLR